MIMSMAFGMAGDHYWSKSIKKINVSFHWDLSFFFFFHWPALKFPLIHSPAFLEPNAGQWRLMHFYCTSRCKAQSDVRASGNHLGSELDSAVQSNRVHSKSCIMMQMSRKCLLV